MEGDCPFYLAINEKLMILVDLSEVYDNVSDKGCDNDAWVELVVVYTAPR